MQNIIERYKKLRLYLLDGIKDLSVEQLNEVPAEFSNNIIWNIAHLVVTQQIICYKRAGKDISIDTDFFEQFKPGSKPEVVFDEAFIKKVKTVFIESIDALEKDYDSKYMGAYVQDKMGHLLTSDILCKITTKCLPDGSNSAVLK